MITHLRKSFYRVVKLRILALIIARGGSKRVPGKNIRKPGTRPLIVWRLDAVNGIPEICDILFSTDDPALADVARNADGLVPCVRPAELAPDPPSSREASIH